MYLLLYINILLFSTPVKPEGQTEIIKIKFESNPKPGDGHWIMAQHEQRIPLGAGSVNGEYTSGFPEPEVE